MRFSHFFIDRPIFASVLSLIILIVGGIAQFRLPISEYPEIAPPTVTINATYPGAIGHMIEPILPAAIAVQGQSGDFVGNAAKESARRTAARIGTQSSRLVLA